MRNYLQPVMVVFLLSVATSTYFFMQPQLKVLDRKGWDGTTYQKMCQYFKGQPTDAEFQAPFNQRIGLPWLASLFDMPPAKAFKVINLTSGFLTVLFTYLSLRGRCNMVVMIACLTPLLFYFNSPIRLPNFNPFTVDPPAMLLYALAAYFLSKDHLLSSAIVLAGSVFFRESGVYFGIGLGIVLFYQGRHMRWKACFAVGTALAAGLFISELRLPGPHHSQLRHIFSMIYHRLLDPSEMVRIVASVSLTLGPAAIFRFYGNFTEVAKEKQLIHSVGAVCLFLSLAMGALGGADTTRIFYIGYPLFVFVLTDWFNGQDAAKVAIATLAGMAANRFLVIFSEPVNDLPSHDVSGLFALTPDHAHIAISVMVMACWVLLWFALFGPGWSFIQSWLGCAKKLTIRRGIF